MAFTFKSLLVKQLETQLSTTQQGLFNSLHWCSSCLTAVQLFVQISKLLQKSLVRRNVPVGADCFDGVGQRHVFMDHQVGQNQGGRAAEPHCTVNKHLTCQSQETKTRFQWIVSEPRLSFSIFTTWQSMDYCVKHYSKCPICSSSED